MDRSPPKKVNMETVVLKGTLDQLDLVTYLQVILLKQQQQQRLKEMIKIREKINKIEKNNRKNQWRQKLAFLKNNQNG